MLDYFLSPLLALEQASFLKAGGGLKQGAELLPIPLVLEPDCFLPALTMNYEEASRGQCWFPGIAWGTAVLPAGQARC